MVLIKKKSYLFYINIENFYILQAFSHFTYVTAHYSPSFPSLHLRHSSFSNSSLALPTSQLILQPFRRFTYVIAHSPTLPLLHLRHSSFSNPSFASTTSQDFHLRHLASRSWHLEHFEICILILIKNHHRVKWCLVFFWDCYDVVLTDYALKRQTITGAYYRNLLTRLRYGKLSRRCVAGMGPFCSTTTSQLILYRTQSHMLLLWAIKFCLNPRILLS